MNALTPPQSGQFASPGKTTGSHVPQSKIVQDMQLRAEKYTIELTALKQNKPFMNMMELLLSHCDPKNIGQFLKGADSAFGVKSLKECVPNHNGGVKLIRLIKRIAPDFFQRGFLGEDVYLKGEFAKTLLSILDFSFSDSGPEIGEKVKGLKPLLGLHEMPQSTFFLNLSGMDLSGVDLDVLDLSDTDLSYTKLAGCNLEGTNLSNANLCSSDLSGANLKKANLSEANLRNSIFTGAILIEARLSFADLCGASLMYTNLRGANFNNADLSFANLSYADASDTIFNDGPPYQYTAAKLYNATLFCTNFSNADIHNVNLKGADWKEALWIGVKCKYSEIIQLAEEQEKAKLEHHSTKSFLAISQSPDFNPHGLPKELIGLIKGNLGQLAIQPKVPPKE